MTQREELLLWAKHFNEDQMELLLEYVQEMYHRIEDAYDNE